MRNFSRLAIVACIALTLKGSFIAQPSIASVITLVGTGVAATSGDSNTVTTGAYDTTTAKLIAMNVSTSSSTPAVVSDSNGNTWACLTPYSSLTGVESQICYSVNPIVGAGHTFTAAIAGQRPGVCVLAFSGVLGFDAGKDAGLNSAGSVTSAQPGSLTPSAANSLMLTGFAWNATISAVTIDSGFISPAQAFVARGATGNGCGLTYLIETSIAAKNPTWAWTTGTAPAVNQAVFQVLPATSSGGVAPRSSMH